MEPFQEIIQSQDVIVEDGSLVIGRGRENVRDTAVIIPFDIFNIGLVQHIADLLKNTVHHFFSGKVQDQLASADQRFAAGDDHGPVGVLPVQMTVFADHFRFDPDAELHAEIVDPADQRAQALAQLLFIHGPIAQAGGIGIPLAEPAVVHNDHLDAQVMGFFGQIVNGAAGEIKIGGFPAVDQDRAGLCLHRSSAYMMADAGVQVLGKSGKAAAAVGHNDFRCRESLPRFNGIMEAFFAQSHLQSCPAELILAGFRPETAAVDELHGPASAGCFGGIPVCQDDQGVELVGGHAAAAADGLHVMADRSPFQVPLHTVASMEGKQVEITMYHIQARALDLIQIDRLVSPVLDPETAGNDIIFGQNAVQQVQLYIGDSVPQNDLKCLGLFLVRVDCRQALQGILAGRDCM